MEKEMGYCQSSRRRYPKCNETPELEMEADHLEQNLCNGEETTETKRSKRFMS